MLRSNTISVNHCMHTWLRVGLVLVLVCTFFSQTVTGVRIPVPHRKTSAKLQPRADELRLPTSVIPEHYIIRVIPYIYEGNFTFDGEVTINVRCDSSTSAITLNIDDMTIDETSVTIRSLADGTSIPVNAHSYDEDQQFYIIQLNENLQVGSTYSVYIKYLGVLNHQGVGFYRSSYTEGNETKWLAVTDFETSSARRAFPCFDEPAMKARFEVSVGRDSTSLFTSLSNMDLRETVPMDGHPGWVWDNFNLSPPMSTYLVAITVSECLNSTSPPGLSTAEYRVWTRRDLINYTGYATEFGPRVLTYFEKYFNVSYPLPKQDLIGISEFLAGAMENWGLITFREEYLTYDPATSTAVDKYYVATVIAHETGHEWTGDLVTIEWWSDIWLNEGFASYLENIGTAGVETDWHMDEQFLLDNNHYIMEQDALETSHPIIANTSDPDASGSLFDSITYQKGASIVRMMDGFLSTETFRKGMNNYLVNNAYGNVLQDDLFIELTQQGHADGTLPSEITVKQIMDTWTLQMGYPLITVTRDYAAGTVTVSQKRFLSRQSGLINDTRNYLWWVPLSYTDQTSPNFDDTTPKEWLQEETEKTLSGMPDESNWVIFNIKETGYYRVNYDQKNWELLFAQLESDPAVISTNNRAQIINDAINLVNANELDYLTFLSSTRYLSKELEYVPWQTAFDALDFIKNMFLYSEGFYKFRNYMVGLVEPAYKTVTIVESPDESIVTTFLRTEALPWACEMDLKDCLTDSLNLYDQWMNEVDPDRNNPISVNIKSSVYCNGIKQGSVGEWDFAWQRYLAATASSERSRLISAMGCSREVWILNRYLDWTIDANSGISRDDGSRVVAAVADNPNGQSLAFDFVRSHWQEIIDYYSVSTAATMLLEMSSNMNTQLQFEELTLFKNEHLNDLGLSLVIINQALNNVEQNVNWMNANYASIGDWLETNTPTGTKTVQLRKTHL